MSSRLPHALLSKEWRSNGAMGRWDDGTKGRCAVAVVLAWGLVERSVQPDHSHRQAPGTPEENENGAACRVVECGPAVSAEREEGRESARAKSHKFSLPRTVLTQIGTHVIIFPAIAEPLAPTPPRTRVPRSAQFDD
ncbi:hypothetical protein CC78DRAFT_575879 [Lojkania enalia]|uniref:Uncharacterized protein n=1 Tax=Lojkania enalia TaxID=147567 RepID=A0A9P4N738_9PLEO|nr:hypothetical protein CC78DRAFT_575879 [Didymosphaeria enalia]